MKTCCAGHELVAFGSTRCPLCEKIEAADKLMLSFEIKLEEMEAKVRKLTNEKVSNLKKNWNGGAT